MSEATAIDLAHGAMQAAPGDDAARLRFYARLGDAELFLLLTEEARDDILSPQVFDVAEGRFAVAFDRDERLARFAGRPVPYAALSGRVLAGMLAGQGIGLGLNLDVAPSAILIPAAALAWLRDVLDSAPTEVETMIAALGVPRRLPPALVAALEAKLAGAGGLARAACLAGVSYRDGGQGLLLGFIDAVAGARPALAKAVSEALSFSGIEDGALDVGFFASGDPVAARLEAAGIRLDLPAPRAPEPIDRPAPGSDPRNPPRLR